MKPVRTILYCINCIKTFEIGLQEFDCSKFSDVLFYCVLVAFFRNRDNHITSSDHGSIFKINVSANHPAMSCTIEMSFPKNIFEFYLNYQGTAKALKQRSGYHTLVRAKS